MLNDYAKGMLMAHHIDPETVESVDGDMLVTFKDGSQRRLCEVWSRRQPKLRLLKNSSKRGNTL